MHRDLRQTKRDLVMVTYIDLNVDECWLISSMPQQRFKLQLSLKYVNIEQNAFSWCLVDDHVRFKIVRVHIYPKVKLQISVDHAVFPEITENVDSKNMNECWLTSAMDFLEEAMMPLSSITVYYMQNITYI